MTFEAGSETCAKNGCTEPGSRARCALCAGWDGYWRNSPGPAERAEAEQQRIDKIKEQP